MKNPRSFLTLLALTLLVTALTAQNPAKPNPALAPIQDDPKLPRVLLIGDSISIGYTLPVRKLLAGQANVHRIPENGGPTTRGLANIDAWLGNGKWDVIHFNWGLHDLRLENGKPQVSIEEYEKNLRQLVQRMKKTGATLIWASTTPAPDASLNPPRRNDDIVAYNAVAKKVMEEEGVRINDLYAFALPRLKEIQRPANVHFTDKGSEVLAEQVARSIQAALKK
ncbi:MAG: SGNH/GDSL hydrolase family protein [Gemmataceae bacterium]|nr:SGNH/GDSL hydrolase family protein [Gemmataceae bacterium]MDW8265674.1 SGNH/GDSL hydrolase family protein [Gemmataceae bacterium]